MRTSTTTGAENTSSIPKLAFYCVSNSQHFLGAVALLNSLRLLGHDEPIFLVDAGLTPEQKRAVSDHVTLIAAPGGVVPVLLAPFGPIERPAEVAILLDADIIVVHPLRGLAEEARLGRLVAFVNNPPNGDRFFAEWRSTLSLGPLRRHPYLNAGQLVVPDSLGRTLFKGWIEGQAKIDVQRTRYGKATLSDPFYFADQDVFNAVVASSLQASQVVTLEHRLAPHPPFSDLRILDEQRLLCQYSDGVRPFVLHHTLGKPWLKATRSNAYSLLFPRLLLASDVALRLRPEDVPLRLRPGRLAAADRRRAGVQAVVYSSARRELGRLRVRTRLRNWRHRYAATRG